jgi:hypothetical protein
VDEFSGSFGYNLPVLSIPGPNGSGYTVNLSYRSGEPFDGASWVGYGWSLGPGGIVRNKRGFPDDWADTVLYWNKNKIQYTVTTTSKKNLEIMSTDKIGVGLSHEFTAIFNSQRGYSVATGIGAMVKGIGGINISQTEDGTSYEPYINPVASLLNPFGWSSGDGKFTSYGKFMPNRGTGLHLGIRFGPEVDKPARAMTGFEGNTDLYNSSFLLSGPAFLIGLESGSRGSVTWYKNVPVTPLRGIGYMYSSTAVDDPNAVMDYLTDREIPYSERNTFLSAPFSNADNYSVTGGIGGSFRLYFTKPGTFRPNTTSSSFYLFPIGSEWHGGLRFGYGANFGVGYHSYDVEPWPDNDESSYAFPAATDSTCFFRMFNDRGGKAIYSLNDDLSTPLLTGGPFSYGVAQDNVLTALPQGVHSGRSTFIGFHTNGDMLLLNGDTLSKSYNKDALSRSFVNRSDAKIQNGIGEFALYDGGGNRMVYGLPVYARNEKQLSFGLEGLTRSHPSDIKSNFLAYSPSVASNSQVTIGEERSAPYATSYLLTEVTTPDYIDITGDGPSADDYGGYTKFSYRRAAGTAMKSQQDSLNPWFQWRAPYNGLTYDRGDLCEPSDDLGSMSSGEREQYYPSSIETKTHIAFFITNHTSFVRGGRSIHGSLAERQDGYQQMTMSNDSLEAYVAGHEDATAARLDSTGEPLRNIQEKLERIELYAKGVNGASDTLLQTVYFDYDYSLRRGMPNSLPGDSGRAGLLTLKRVWSQSQGVANAKISPITFGYSYKTSADYAGLPSDVRTKYADIIGFGDRFTGAMQNPGYSPFAADRWGSYQAGGAGRFEKLNPWVNQRADTSFDPAAWQLKWVHMPTGGELHVQYEQNEYAYVQDRPAMAMVSLIDTLPGSSLHSLDSNQDDRYYLRLGDIRVDSTSYGQVATVRSLIQREVVDRKKKLYFRFLYALKGNHAQLDSTEYSAGYITGFATVGSLAIDTVGKGLPGEWYALRVTLRGNSAYPVPPNGGSEDFTVPKKICWDFVKKNKLGKLSPYDGVPFGESISMIATLQGKVGDIWMSATDYCKDIDYDNSYIRIPMSNAKRGAGVRVKRLLSYDPGIQNDGALYGTEYSYDVYDESRAAYISSGVAVNEPELGREENALVDIASHAIESAWAEKFIAGKDLPRHIGPLGASLLPGAGVGYSRVVARNIHAGKTNPGFSINEFLTARDYPYDKRYSGTSGGARYSDVISHLFRPPFLDALPWFKTHLDHVWASQGFSFIQNNMHGQPRRSAVYGGRYDDESSWALTGLQEFNYFEPGEQIPMLHGIGDSITYEEPGKEMDIVSEGTSIEDETIDASVEGDISMLVIPPFTPMVSAQLYSNYNSNTVQTRATTKVIRYPAIVKNVLTYGDGMYHYAENVAFSSETGSPVVVRTNDGFDRLKLEQPPTPHEGSYISYTIPASEKYSSMGQKAANIANTNQLSAVAGGLVTYGETLSDVAAGRTLSNQHVISASAQTFATESIPSPDNVSSYTSVWRPRDSYVYRTSIVGGSKQSTTERNYNAGIFDDFTPFSWSSPSSGDSTKWLRTGSITKYTPDGMPVETKDGLGMFSGTQLGYGRTVPVISAVNAHEDGILFNSFEENPFIPEGIAHAGKRSIGFKGVSASFPVGDITAYASAKDSSLLIRAWVKFSNYDMKNTPSNYLYFDVGGTHIAPLAGDEVAKSGEWTLYQVRVKPPLSFQPSNRISITVATSNLETRGDSVWVDDIVAQPLDAVASCAVYDPATYRPLASFDADHFGIYNQYNAEGSLVRNIVETTEGRKTVLEVHPHIPLTDRDEPAPGNAPMRREGGDSPAFDNRSVSSPSVSSPSGRIDLLDVRIDPTKRDVKVLGSDGTAVPSIEDLKGKVLDPSLVPGAERWKLIEEMKGLDKDEATIVAKLTSEDGAEDPAELLERRDGIRKRRAALLQQLGMTEDAVRSLYDAVGDPGEGAKR